MPLTAKRNLGPETNPLLKITFAWPVVRLQSPVQGLHNMLQLWGEIKNWSSSKLSASSTSSVFKNLTCIFE